MYSSQPTKSPHYIVSLVSLSNPKFFTPPTTPRKRMGKYKPLSQPKKCVDCQQKTVTGAYHAICNACASARQVCAKCLENKEILPSTEQPKEDAIREKMELDRILEKMNERQRRSYLRKRERGDDEGADKIKNSAESKADDDDFEFSDSEEEEEFNEDGEEDEDNE